METNQEIMDSEDACFLLRESKDLKIILADNHNTRLSELNKIGLYPRRCPLYFRRGKISESLSAEERARKVSEVKVRKVADHFIKEKEHYDMIIGFRTSIVVDGERVERVHGREEALQLLKILNNRSHSVVTGVTLLHSSQKCETFHVETKVQFGDNPEEWFQKYLQTDEWIQYPTIYSTINASVAFIEHVDGCPFNILGVPKYELVQRIKKLMIDGKKIPETDNKENVVSQQQQIYAKENEKNDDLESNIGKEMKLNASGDEKAKKPIPPPQAVAPVLQKKSEAVIKDGTSKHPYSDEEFDFLKQYIKPAVNSSNDVVDDGNRNDGEKFKEKTNIDSVNVVAPSTTEKPADELNDEYDNKPSESGGGQKEASRSDFSNRPPCLKNAISPSNDTPPVAAQFFNNAEATPAAPTSADPSATPDAPAKGRFYTKVVKKYT